jgi:hypothetical protein
VSAGRIPSQSRRARPAGRTPSSGRGQLCHPRPKGSRPCQPLCRITASCASRRAPTGGAAALGVSDSGRREAKRRVGAGATSRPVDRRQNGASSKGVATRRHVTYYGALHARFTIQEPSVSGRYEGRGNSNADSGASTTAIPHAGAVRSESRRHLQHGQSLGERQAGASAIPRESAC